jgi:hypothetical protein
VTASEVDALVGWAGPSGYVAARDSSSAEPFVALAALWQVQIGDGTPCGIAQLHTSRSMSVGSLLYDSF